MPLENKTKESITSIEKRLLVHILFFFCGILLSVFFEVIYDKNNFPLFDCQSWGLLSWLSLLLLFPRKQNNWATFLGILAGIECILFGGGYAFVVAAGLVSFTVNSFTKRFSFGSLGAFLLLSLFYLAFFYLEGGETGTKKAPFALYLSWFIFSIIGIYPEKLSSIFHVNIAAFSNALNERGFSALNSLSALLNRKNTPIITRSVNSKEDKGQEDMANEPNTRKKVTPYHAKKDELVEPVDEYADYKSKLEGLTQYKNSLAATGLVNLLENIQQKGLLVVKCMEEDVRDVIPGRRFLNRYLPMAESVVNQLVKFDLSTEQESDPFADISQQFREALSNLSSAFTQMHQKLLENDIDDLAVDLNVLNKLLKSEGFD